MMTSTYVSANVSGGMTIWNPFKAPWPDPEASICSSSKGCGTVRGKFHWSVRGPALQAYDTIKDKIKQCLEDRGNDLYDSYANESSVPHSIYCLMVGSTLARARPYVVLACGQDSFSKNAMRIIKDTTWWKEFIGEQPGFGGFLLLQLAPIRMADASKTTPIRTSLVYTSDQHSSFYNMPIFFTAEQLNRADPCARQQATFGNIIYLDDMPFGLTVAHPLVEKYGDTHEQCTQHTDAVVYMDDSGDDEDSGDKSSPDLGSNIVSFRERAPISQTRQGTQILESQPLQGSPRLVGQLVCRSEGTPSDAVDWALIALHPSYFELLRDGHTDPPEKPTTQRPQSPQQPSSREERQSAQQKRFAVMDRDIFSDDYDLLPFGMPQTILHSSGDAKSMLLPDGKHGFRQDFLDANESLVCLAGSRQYLPLHSVVLQEDLLPGICGKWLIDSDGNWCGHIVAGLPGTRIAYAACASQIFSDIEKRTGCAPSISSRARYREYETYPERFGDWMSDESGGVSGPVLGAASAWGLEDVVKMLLSADVDVNAHGQYQSALQAAASAGHEKVVQMLLDSGADVNVQVGYHGSALQAASVCGREKVIQLLLNAGADVNIQGGYYGSALQAAASAGHEKVVQMLLDSGVDVNVPVGYHGSALQAAASAGHEKVVQMLLDSGVDVNVQVGYHGSALQAASVCGREKVIQMLLNAGADVNIQGGYYGSALQAASACGREKIVQMLLDAGPDVNIQGGYYGSAMQASSARGDEKITKMLWDAGAELLDPAVERGHESNIDANKD
jgi:ankyrin repeat protein